MAFIDFSKAITQQFANMVKGEATLYLSEVSKDTLWDTYLGSFPEGTNPIYKERTEYDCQCCRSFIRTVGGLVTIVNGELVSIWDVQIGGYYQVVADALSAVVKAAAIDNIFLHTEKVAGVAKNFQQILSGEILTWNHFHVNLPASVVVRGDTIGPKQSESRSTHDVFLRGLQSITTDAIDTTIDLITQNSLYRGEEHLRAVQEFQKFKLKFDKLPKRVEPGTFVVSPSLEQDLFVWANQTATSLAISRIRNTAIGTLLSDLSEDKDLEYAVKSFEQKVAPTNYKRTTSLVTKVMIAKAQAKIEELGLTSALERRYATLEDIKVTNVLHANRVTKKAMNVFETLSSAVPEKVKNFDKVEEVPIAKFLSDILPKAESISVMFENRHAGNLVSLIAPVDPTAHGLFKWSNNFSWSYAGEVADSMRDRVAQLGGRVDGALRFTHAWNHPEVGRNASLMDLHVFMPGSSAHREGCHDSYPSGRRVGWNHRNDNLSGGTQDVDHTAAAAEGFIPVENISFPSLGRMPEGKYVFKIHNWEHRSPTNSGFKAEIEFGGQIFYYNHPQPMKQKEWVTLAEVTLRNGVFTIEHKLASSQSSMSKWNLNSQTFQKVNVVMLSPNHWDGQLGIGNRHYFFMLDGCHNEEKARGFYNEFLSAELEPHRKTMEMVGSKMRTEQSDRQLSGLGFSSTQRAELLCQVNGSFSRVVKIIF
jgi:hypothetical protein